MSALLKPSGDPPVIGRRSSSGMGMEASLEAKAENVYATEGQTRMPVQLPWPAQTDVAVWYRTGWDNAGAYLCARGNANVFVWLFRRPRPRQPNEFIYGAEAFCISSKKSTDMRARCRYDNTHQARRAACRELARLGAKVPMSSQ